MGFSYSGKLFGGTGSGGVSVSGGVNTQVAYFTGASSLSSDSGLTYNATTDVLTAGAVVAKNVTVSGLATPGSITVTPTGTTGATTYTYRLVARLADGTTTEAGANSSTATGNATLSAANYNALSWSAVTGADSYDVYRTVGGATQGKIASATTALSLNDTGLAGGGETAPTVNTTGLVLGKNIVDATTLNNVALGSTAQRRAATGGSNVAVGQQAQFGLSSGSFNTSVGHQANYGLTTGAANTSFGYGAGNESGASPTSANTVTTGSYTTFVGFRSGLGSTTQRTNATAIGARAYVDADNTVVLGDAAVADVLMGSTGLARTKAGEAVVQTTNGAGWTRAAVSELITLSTSGTTTDSSANLLPANSIIEAVVARVTTAITTATDWKLGDASTPGRFTAANSTLTAGTTDVGLVHVDQAGAAGPRQTTAAKLRVTTTGTPGAGVVRVTVFYRQFTPPAS